MRSFLLFMAAIEAAWAKVELPPLPYEYTALEPMISARTLTIHHDKHHAKYVNTMNSLIAGTEMDALSLEDIVKSSYGKDRGLFNNAAQSWNHAFYWKCMTAKGGGKPKSKLLLDLINQAFGSYDKFKAEFANAGNTAFGSGWAWLCYNTKLKRLFVTKSIGGDTPLTSAPDVVPILTMDVWEHAYYLDYQNLRASYVDAFLDKLVNWDFVEQNLKDAQQSQGSDEL